MGKPLVGGEAWRDLGQQSSLLWILTPRKISDRDYSTFTAFKKMDYLGVWHGTWEGLKLYINIAHQKNRIIYKSIKHMGYSYSHNY